MKDATDTAAQFNGGVFVTPLSCAQANDSISCVGATDTLLKVGLYHAHGNASSEIEFGAV